MFGAGTGTFGIADVYGGPSAVRPAFDPLGVANTNGATVAPATQSASGGGPSSGSGPALSLLGLAVGLIGLRVLVELADRA